jgi:hypothetical protein
MNLKDISNIIIRKFRCLPWKNWQQKKFGHRYGPIYLILSSLHFRLARLVFIITTFSFKFTKIGQIKKDTFYFSRCDVSGLKKSFAHLIENAHADLSGREKLTQNELQIISSDIANCLNQVKDFIEDIYGTHFRINLVSASRMVSGEKNLKGSFHYHYDNASAYSLKVFFYLNDQFEANGAFRVLDLKTTQQLISQGFDSAGPSSRENSQALVTNEIANELKIAEGKEGTVLLWHNRLIHKATLPKKGVRDLVQLEIIPSVFSQSHGRSLRNPPEVNTDWEIFFRNI